MHPYSGQTFAFATKHQKELLIKDTFLSKLNVEIMVADVDTDQLGTFSGEIERTKSIFDTAVEKAKLALEFTGLDFGLASEGSISNDSAIPFLVSDLEIMVLVDQRNDLVISESFRSFEIIAATKEVHIGDELNDFLIEADFPNHKLIARVNREGRVKAIKGIGDEKTLLDAIKTLASLNGNGLVTLEPDFRAHNCPSRQVNIKKVAEKLLDRLITLCPECRTPGFGKIDFLRGLTCNFCGLFDESAIRQELLTCVKCSFHKPGTLVNSELDPARCQTCNP